MDSAKSRIRAAITASTTFPRVSSSAMGRQDLGA